MSDSYTNFDPAAVCAGAVGGAALFGAALVSGMRAVVQANREACERWDREQLERAYECSELLRYGKAKECEELRAENARLRAVIKSMTVRPAPASR
jgi:hypothetical protein